MEILCKLDPKVDFAFKKLFGSEENKSILRLTLTLDVFKSRIE